MRLLGVWLPRGIVDFEIDVQVLLTGEGAGDAGNQLLTFVHQGMVDQQLLIGARADGLGDGLALSAPDHRTDTQALPIRIQVGNGEVCLESAHLAGELRGAFAHFDFDGVAHVALDLALGVGDLADEVEFRGIAGAAARQGDFAAGDLDRHRHKIMVAHQAEVVDLQSQRQIRHGVAEEQRLLQLPLPIRGGRFVECHGGEIPVAEVELRLELLGNLDLHAAEFAIFHGIGVVIAEHIVAAEVLVGLLDAQGEVVRIQQGLAAGIVGEREQGFLLVVELGLLRGDGISGEHLRAARGCLAGVSAGNQRHQAAGIDGVERDVGANGGVDGGFELRVVLDARLGDAGGEVDERLFLGQGSQHADRGFQARQLAVRVEDVEFGFVGDEGGAGILAAVGVAGIRLDGKFAGLPDLKTLDHLGQAVAVGGEILGHLNGGAQGHDGHHVGRGHLLGQELQGGFLGPDLFLGLHGREIEEQHQ